MVSQTFPFNFNGSNPFVDAVQSVRGKLSASGYLDMSVNQAINEAGAAIGLDLNNIDMSGPLKSLDEMLTTKNLAFPQNLDSVGNLMNIDIFKERIFEAGLGVTRNNREKLLTIKLPLPSSLQTAYSQGYKQEGLGPIGVAGGAAAGDLAQKILGGGSVTGADFKNAAEKLFGENSQVGVSGMASLGLEAANEIAAGVGAAAGNAIGLPLAGAVVGDQLGKAVQGATAKVGIARNPHMAVLYEAPNFRTFQFSFDLKPKNVTESFIINEIIKKLKFYSHPARIKDEHFFQYPEQMGIRFKKDGFLFRTRSLVLTNLNIEYHGEGTPLYYDTGGKDNNQKAPAAVKLDTTFTETRILTKTDIQDGM